MQYIPKFIRLPDTYSLGTIVILLYSCSLLPGACKSEIDSKKQSSGNSPVKTEMSAALVKANQLTQSVFHYVEMVETKKMTKEEADKLSSPIKNELQSIRSQLSKQELMYNDSIRKAYGNIMVDNVMKWRAENGLLQPEDQ